MPSIAARVAIDGAVHKSSDRRRKEQSRVFPAPFPPVGTDMSVMAFSPFGPSISHRKLPCQTAVAVVLGLRAANGLAMKRRFARSNPLHKATQQIAA